MSPLPEKILLATNGSEDAKLAARAAADFSAKTGAQLHIIHAWQYVPHPVLDSEATRKKPQGSSKSRPSWSPKPGPR